MIDDIIYLDCFSEYKHIDFIHVRDVLGRIQDLPLILGRIYRYQVHKNTCHDEQLDVEHTHI
jgi:hypothetical protein